jgi:hypothetical protein
VESAIQARFCSFLLTGNVVVWHLLRVLGDIAGELGPKMGMNLIA